MRCQIAPSVLSFEHGLLKVKVQELADAGAGLIHLDIMDGRFVPPISFGDGVAKSLAAVPGPSYEAHLMIEQPDAQFERFVSAGCKRLIFHAEATPHAHRLVGALHEMGAQAGIAINPGTPAEVVRPLLDIVDLVLVMTVNPGWGGQQFIEEALEKVRMVRSWSSSVEIEVDGGIDEETLPLARESGANLFVVGSHLLSYPSLADALRELSALCD